MLGLFAAKHELKQRKKEMANLAVTGLLNDELGEQILATASHIIEQINAA